MNLSPMPKNKTVEEKDLVPGSKIPIAFLLDYFKEGLSINDFISAYPWVKKAEVTKALEEIKKRDFAARHAF